MICASIWMVDLWLETSENCEERASPLKLIVRMMQKFLYAAANSGCVALSV